ncbi:MAG: hypothetical protein KJ957_06485, partial [Candidatus Omnitrophica bacterium]|nr:hypothetical protein [Candidatus Omnitrophota bacterium]
MLGQKKQDKEKTFRFYTRLNLRVLTGLKASNIEELLALIKEVPGSSIYYHTHHFLQQHMYISPEPPNDFSYWIATALNEDVLGEKIASIDTIRYPTIRTLRNEIIRIMEGYINDNPRVKLRFASPNKVFHFIKSASFILPTPYVALDLKDFVAILKQVTIDSIYFHMFEARLRLDKETNDFSYWLETSLLEGELAERIKALDPYTYTMESLRRKLIEIVG